jgi:hypothetical protein
MLYAHFMGYLSEIRYTKDNTPFAKCLVRTTSGKEMEVRIFGQNDLRDLEYGSVIRIEKNEVTAGFWQGFIFYNGYLTGHCKMRLSRLLDFSIADGFSLSSLN